MSWKEHKLTQIQRYVQGVEVLGKYAELGRPDWGRSGNTPGLIITSATKIMPEHLELLNYLGWHQVQELTPYIGQYEHHFELYWEFRTFNKVWVED